MTYYAHINTVDNSIGVGQVPVSGDNIVCLEIIEEVYNNIDRYIYNGTELILDPDYDLKQQQARQAEFLKEFFLTSLGYIRRSVTMADGSHKDFLSDLLPVISMGVQGGQTVNIIAYEMPDFTTDVTDWTQYQHIQVVTPQFIQECFLQLQNDFIPVGAE